MIGRVLDVRIAELQLGLEEPYSVAYGSTDSTTNFVLTLTTDGPWVGYGCAVPEEAVTGETAKSARETFLSVVEPVLRNADPWRYRGVLEALRPLLVRHPSVQAAVDMALYDLMAKKAGLPLWKLLGGYRDHIETSITIGILPVNETVERAKHWVGSGFTCLKIKGGHDWRTDVERVRKVREAVGSSIKLRFDANQGYTVEDCLSFLRASKDVALELIEQPTPKHFRDRLTAITREGLLPVMADETLMTIEDARLLGEERSTQLFNVKLMKIGGIAASSSILSVAAAYGIGVMVGCMDEMALGISAGLHLTLSTPYIQLADLDGHIGLIGDPSEGSVVLKDGNLYPRDVPGLGFEGL